MVCLTVRLSACFTAFLQTCLVDFLCISVPICLVHFLCISMPMCPSAYVYIHACLSICLYPCSSVHLFCTIQIQCIFLMCEFCHPPPPFFYCSLFYSFACRNNGPITAFSNKVFIRGNNLTTVSVIDVALSSAAPPYFVSFQPENASPSPLNAITVMAVDSQPLGGE